MLSRRIVLGRQLISIAGSCNYHALSTTPVLLKDKSDNRSSGLAAPRKQFVQEQKEKKMKSEEDKERQRAERLEREKQKKEIRREQLSRSKALKEKEADQVKNRELNAKIASPFSHFLGDIEGLDDNNKDVDDEPQTQPVKPIDKPASASPTPTTPSSAAKALVDTPSAEKIGTKEPKTNDTKDNATKHQTQPKQQQQQQQQPQKRAEKQGHGQVAEPGQSQPPSSSQPNDTQAKPKMTFQQLQQMRAEQLKQLQQQQQQQQQPPTAKR